MPTNSEWNGTPEFRDAICFLMYVQLWNSLPAPRFLASHPALHSEFRDALTFPFTFLEFEPVFEYSIKGRTGPNFVTDYVPVPVRTLRNHTPAHVFWVLHPKPDTEFRDGMSSWVGIVLLRITFSGRIS